MTPLENTTNQLKKPKTRLSGTNLRQSSVNLVRTLLLLRFCGYSPQQLGFDWISIRPNTIFELKSSFEDSNLRSRTEVRSKKIPPPSGSHGLPVMVVAGSGWRRGEVHGVEQGGSWCLHRDWSRQYAVMCTANGPTARCSLWGRMSLRRATAPVLECPSLIHTVSARDAAGRRQSLMMPVIVRLWVASDTLVGGTVMRGMVWSSWRVRALRLASCPCWASWAGVCTPACLGFLLGRSAVLKGVGQEGA